MFLFILCNSSLHTGRNEEILLFQSQFLSCIVVIVRVQDLSISNAKEFGPYFVICPDLALLHARPEQGVIKRQLAVTVLREPVRFKEEGPDVRLLVTLAAEDADSHIDVMRKLAVMFSDPANITKIAEAKDADEVYAEFCAPTEE